MNLPTDQIIQCDCSTVLRKLPEACIDLAYIDPPFNTGKSQATATAMFEDRWSTLDAYLVFMREVVEHIHRVLRPTGSLLLHCDWRTAHHLRLVLDEVFGAERFVNHLIWSYGLGGSSPRRFARKHDDILFYGRTDAYYFDPPRVPATSERMKGQMKKATDILNVPAINNMSNERTGYPTQKPLALLELLVTACSPRSGLVLDPCCGSGTTLVAAKRLSRHYIGIDLSTDAIAIASQRIEQASRDGALDSSVFGSELAPACAVAAASPHNSSPQQPGDERTTNR